MKLRNKISMSAGIVLLTSLIGFSSGRCYEKNQIIDDFEMLKRSAYDQIRHQQTINGQKMWREHGSHWDYANEYLKDNLKFGETLK